ncbi:MAG: hypothetical protein PVF73_11280, partial [Bacteroidales bacterium]
MRLKITLLFVLCIVYRSYGNFIPADTTNQATNDSSDYYLEMDDAIESNFEVNLDSMVNLWYVKQSVDTDSLYTVVKDSIVPDFPDSVYIERLSEITTIVDLPYNRIVKNYIDVYAKKRRSTVEVMLGLSEYYF